MVTPHEVISIHFTSLRRVSGHRCLATRFAGDPLRGRIIRTAQLRTLAARSLMDGRRCTHSGSVVQHQSGELPGLLSHGDAAPGRPTNTAFQVGSDAALFRTHAHRSGQLT